MKIINDKREYTRLGDSVFNGRIELTKKEFDYAINHILKNRQVNKYYSGAGKYAYIGKDTLKEKLKQSEHRNLSRYDLSNGKTGAYTIYALGVYITDYIVGLFKNKSRHNYKRQNYLISVHTK